VRIGFGSTVADEVEMTVETAWTRSFFAADPAESRGRLHQDPASPRRSAFRRDCDRIIHASAFRRLAHKTQVFVYHEGDHYRTRLTHTLEVTQIARSLARALGLDEDLAEASALAHDLGHPPFGHAGERALDRCLADHGGFDHNAQTISVLTRLERRYAAFDGLNLTWETLEGLAKHNGPLIDQTGRPAPRYAERGIPRVITEYCKFQDLELASYPSAEAQAGAIADDIAYDAHDIDDGLRAEMFSLGDLAAVPMIGEILHEIDVLHPRIDAARRVHELIRQLITRMIEDVITESERRLSTLAPCSADDVRHAGHPLVGFSPAMTEADRAIKNFLLPRLYQHPRITRITKDAERVLRELFEHYAQHPQDLPPEWQPNPASADAGSRARLIADFIAGMTDRFALTEHARLLGATPELR
jgi:dGTPase